MSLTAYKSRVFPLRDNLFRFALSIVGNRAEAKDVVQEVLIIAWERWDDLQGMDKPEAWLMRATRNKAIDYTRSKHRRTTGLDHALTLENGQRGADERLQAEDQLQKVKRLMAQLPLQQRLVMHLRDIEHLSYREIGDALDLTMSQVKVNLFRARKKVRDAMLQTSEYGTPTD